MRATLAMLMHHFGQDEERYLRALESDGRRWEPGEACSACLCGPAHEYLVSEGSLESIELDRLCDECAEAGRQGGWRVERVEAVS